MKEPNRLQMNRSINHSVPKIVENMAEQLSHFESDFLFQIFAQFRFLIRGMKKKHVSQNGDQPR